MNKFYLSFFVLCFSSAIFAQKSNGVVDFFSAKIDSLTMVDVASGDDGTYEEGEVSSAPVFAKMLTAPVLYSSVVKRGFSGSLDYEETIQGENGMTYDDKRMAVIDGMMMNVYRNHPSSIDMTEEQLRSETNISEQAGSLPTPKIDLTEDVELTIPENIGGGLKTVVKKPSYWRTSGSFSLDFTQNYVSGNWYQGGENNRMMLGEFVLNVNYDNKDRITFNNRFDAVLGFTTVEADTLHSFKTNNDKLRLESTFGYKMVKNLDVTMKMKLETQSLPNYPTNAPDFVSKFMAPFDASFSVGLNYKPSWQNFALEIYVAPLSAYNYRFVRYDELVSRYGIDEGRHHKEDFGTQIIVTVPEATFFNGILSFWSRAEYYTDYKRAFFSWENKFDIKLNRYFKVSMAMHARYDDTSFDLKDEEKYGYWQLKEYMTFGIMYTW